MSLEIWYIWVTCQKESGQLLNKKVIIIRHHFRFFIQRQQEQQNTHLMMLYCCLVSFFIERETRQVWSANNDQSNWQIIQRLYCPCDDGWMHCYDFLGKSMKNERQFFCFTKKETSSREGKGFGKLGFVHAETSKTS